MQFGEKLQLLRKARGWSQEELAQQINVSRQALSKWESGTAVADTENVIALSRLFGVTTDYLLLEDSEVAGAPVNAVSAPAKESKWPVVRVAWLVVLFISAVGLIALQIWASVNPSTTYFPNGTVRWTGVLSFVITHKLLWLSILLWLLLLLGFLGTFFYEPMRAFVRKHILD